MIQVLCTYGFIHQAADTYVDQLQSCRPEILYPQLLHDTPKTEILKNMLFKCYYVVQMYNAGELLRAAVNADLILAV